MDSTRTTNTVAVMTIMFMSILGFITYSMGYKAGDTSWGTFLRCFGIGVLHLCAIVYFGKENGQLREQVDNEHVGDDNPFPWWVVGSVSLAGVLFFLVGIAASGYAPWILEMCRQVGIGLFFWGVILKQMGMQRVLQLRLQDQKLKEGFVDD